MILVIIIYIIFLNQNFQTQLYLVSVLDMLMVEQLKCVGALRDLEHQREHRAGQMLMNGFQSFEIQNILGIGLNLIHLKSGQLLYLKNI